MTYDVEAIYDAGVFRPLVPITIPNGSRVHLRVEEEVVEVVENDAEAEARRRAAMDEFLRLPKELPLEGSPNSSKMMTKEQKSEFLRMMIELPIESPDDGFSGADHDKLLYGQP